MRAPSPAMRTRVILTHDARVDSRERRMDAFGAA
jgi:hypothetical protein